VRTVVVTGFSAFPGAPQNPTARLMTRLARHARRLARLGWRLETRVLPVVYSETAGRLAEIEDRASPRRSAAFRPRRAAAGDQRRTGRRAGVSARSRWTRREQDACARRSRDGPDALRARLPVARVVAAIRATGARCMTISMDAGGYVCNQTFYLSLGRSRAARIGFVHAPPIAPHGGRVRWIGARGARRAFCAIAGRAAMTARAQISD
jgi:pyroglutamyl-peptidase